MTRLIVDTYIAENSKPGFDYLGNDASALAQVTDEQWPSILAALDELNGGAKDPGIDCKLVKTHETFADFDHSRAQHWAVRGTREEYDFGGIKAVKYERFQLHRGQLRETQIVIDLGDYRLCLI